MLKRYPLQIFFALTFALTWGLAILYFSFPNEVEQLTGSVTNSHPLVWLATLSPSIWAVVIIWFTEGKGGLKIFFQKLTHWRVSWKWYAFILIGLPLMGAIAAMLSGQPPFISSISIQTLHIAVLTRMIGDSGTYEELGWSGYAMPQFLKRMNALTSAIVFGVIWAIWHIPAFFVSTMNQSSMGFGLFVIGSIVESILIVWVLQNTNGSILMAMMLHSVINFTQYITGQPTLMFTGLALIITIVIIMLTGKDLRISQKPKAMQQDVSDEGLVNIE